MVERQNPTMRMSMRRFTRLTNAFSKKVENHEHSVAIHYMHYNFCRIHQSLRVTPAMEAGITDHVWSLDEIWGFIGAKRNRAAATGNYGDVWTFIALDADTKLIPNFIVGKRDSYHANAFISDLSDRLVKRVQLSSDSLKAYSEAVERGFGAEVDYGQISKTYSVTHLTKEAAGRFSPAQVVKTEKAIINGMPDVNRISTSHVEKQNHTLRMHCRRLTRLTNAFSKKLENFEAAIAMNFCYYNFVKTHGAIRMTPAQAAGVENSAWTVTELVERCGE
jgi:IS1 family transposase